MKNLQYKLKKIPMLSPLLTLPVLCYPYRGDGGEGQPLYGESKRLMCRFCENKNARQSGGKTIAGSAYFCGGADISTGDLLEMPDGRQFEVFSLREYRLRDGAPHHLRAVVIPRNRLEGL